MNRSTVSSRMWSASTCQGFCQPSCLMAAAAAMRTLEGSEPTMRCSRLDLFQTGMTSTPCSAARRQARNWAWACCAKRSPMPIEYLANLSAVYDITQSITEEQTNDGLLNWILRGRGARPPIGRQSESTRGVPNGKPRQANSFSIHNFWLENHAR